MVPVDGRHGAVGPRRQTCEGLGAGVSPGWRRWRANQRSWQVGLLSCAEAPAELRLLRPAACWDAIDFQEEVGRCEQKRSLGRIYPTFLFYCIPPATPPSCFCPLLSTATPDKQASPFALELAVTFLPPPPPPRKASWSAPISLALVFSSSLFHSSSFSSSQEHHTENIDSPHRSILSPLSSATPTPTPLSPLCLFPPDSHSSCDHNLWRL